MTHMEPNHKTNRCDVIYPPTSIRLPGVAGPVSWRAEVDLDAAQLKILEINLPNGITDTLIIDAAKGVLVKRDIGPHPVDISPAQTRQILYNARIIAGLHLQLAIDNGYGHEP